jgi:hypothetical protein
MFRTLLAIAAAFTAWGVVYGALSAAGIEMTWAEQGCAIGAGLTLMAMGWRQHRLDRRPAVEKAPESSSEERRAGS